MLTFTGLFVDPIFSAEAMVINEKFKSDLTNFSEFVGETIPSKTISHRTWVNLEAPVKEELIRLGYKEEEQLCN